MRREGDGGRVQAKFEANVGRPSDAAASGSSPSAIVLKAAVGQGPSLQGSAQTIGP